MQHLFPPSFGGQSKPPALMLRRLHRRQEALMGPPTDRLFLAVLPDEAGLEARALSAPYREWRGALARLHKFPIINLCSL